MTPEEELKEEEKEEMKEMEGPPIDIVASLSANLQDKQKLLNVIQDYVEDVEKISKVMKGMALMNSNMPAFTSAQSALDVVKDILDLISGKRITTIAEMEEKLKEEQEAMEKKLKAAAEREQQYTY